MEKFLSAVIHIAAASLMCLFGCGQAIRCIINDGDMFYIIMFSLIGLVGWSLFRNSLKEIKSWQ